MEEKLKRNLIIAGCSLLFLCTVGYGGWCLWNRILDNQQRMTLTSYGMPLMAGPINKNGPTFGPGSRADLDTDYRNWAYNGPVNDPNTKHAIMIGVRNKSKRVWHGVEAKVALFDKQGTFIREEPCKFGDLQENSSCRLTFGPIEPEVGMFRVLGYKGH